MRAAKAYVPVRVTDLQGLDLETYAFDYDLTFAALLMNADGWVYHRYGGRDASSAMSSLSMRSMVRLLDRGLETHREYAARPRTWERRQPRTLDDVPAWAEKMAERRREGKAPKCYHCHFVYDAYWEQGQKDGTWDDERIWRYPPPERIGLSLDRDEQERVTAVREGSPAARAGLRAGDRLLRLGTQRVLTHADLSWVLENTPYGGGELPVSYERDGAQANAKLALAEGWRKGTPLEFSWRPSKWRLQPRPGFGGRPLRPAEARELGLKPGAFAFKVGYVVTWGPMPRYGRAAREAGIRKGDVVVRVGDARLTGPQHFHSWWRLTRAPGDVVEVEVLRRIGKEMRRLTLKLEVIE